MIPLCDLKQQYLALKEEIDTAVQGVCANGRYILGPNVRALEQEIAEHLGCRHAIGVNSGTDALHLALRALGIGPGDEVITTPFTFIATSEAICLTGATPAFVDIDPDTLNLNPHLIQSAIMPRTKAIMPVHLFGQPCDMEPIMEVASSHGLFVIEDCAQAIGATYKGKKVGTFGDVGCLSFFPSKNLGCLGDGGMVTTNNAEIFERVEMLRRHGGKVKYHHTTLGHNSRLDELQAAILRVKLPYLSRWNELRRKHACSYNEKLIDCTAVTRPAELDGADTKPVVPSGNSESNDLLTAVYHQYTVQVENRDSVMNHLMENQIGHAVYYPVPLHLQEVHKDLGYQEGAFPNAERAARCCLSLPMFPELKDEQISAASACLRDAVDRQSQLSRVA